MDSIDQEILSNILPTLLVLCAQNKTPVTYGALMDTFSAQFRKPENIALKAILKEVHKLKYIKALEENWNLAKPIFLKTAISPNEVDSIHAFMIRNTNHNWTYFDLGTAYHESVKKNDEIEIRTEKANADEQGSRYSDADESHSAALHQESSINHLEQDPHQCNREPNAAPRLFGHRPRRHCTDPAGRRRDADHEPGPRNSLREFTDRERERIKGWLRGVASYWSTSHVSVHPSIRNSLVKPDLDSQTDQIRLYSG